MLDSRVHVKENSNFQERHASFIIGSLMLTAKVRVPDVQVLRLHKPSNRLHEAAQQICKCIVRLLLTVLIFRDADTGEAR